MELSHSFRAQARFRRHERSAALSLCGTCGDRYQRGAAGPTGMDQSGECDAGGAKHVYVASVAQDAVWIASTGLGGPHQTSELSISANSKSIWLIFGRIDCSRRVLEAQKCLCQNI